jgi:MFS family permease
MNPPTDASIPQWKPHERPMMPGSPATPDHPPHLRVAYAAVGLVVALTGSLGNALVVVNLPNLQGSLGAYTNDVAWLPTVYVMTSVCMNLLLVKFRQQYGIRRFAEIGLAAYILIVIAHLFVNDFRSAVMARAAAGVAGAPLTTLGLFYFIQAFPAAHRLKGIVVALGVSQLGVPIARLIPTDWLAGGNWSGLYLGEMGMAMMSLACVYLLRLPPSDRIEVFEPLDFLTFALFAPGIALLCAVLGLGRYVWWTDAPWIGWALVSSICLLIPALLIEHNRKNPLINTRWLTSADILRLALAVIMVRLVLSEQTVGAIGLLSTLGLNNDQFTGLFTVVLITTIAGFTASALLLDVKNLPRPVLIALALITIGSLLDARATNLTRPENLYLSQAMIAFAGAIFLAPAMMAGLTRVLQQGAGYLASFSVLFSITQTLGGLAGAAALGSLQTIDARRHLSHLSQSLTLQDPLVVQRLQQLSGAYARTLTDPVLRAAEGQVLLTQQVTREANVLAYVDIFLVFAAMAAATFVWLGVRYARIKLKERAEGAA